jgi:hypothetical protein
LDYPSAFIKNWTFDYGENMLSQSTIKNSILRLFHLLKKDMVVFRNALITLTGLGIFTLNAVLMNLSVSRTPNDVYAFINPYVLFIAPMLLIMVTLPLLSLEFAIRIYKNKKI